MTLQKEKHYDKMEDFIESIFNVFKLINTKSEQKKDKRLKAIALVIFNYLIKTAQDHQIDIKKLREKDDPTTKEINLIPFFEYISYNNIELYDFSKIDINDVNTTKKEDLERFVLTHVYYITQQK
jgi:hypothetical protein